MKIFIMAVISNAMNLPVLSLCRAILPGPYARSRSASLGLLWSE